jgi:hypothetical protein
MPWRCMRSGCMDPHSLDLSTSQRWVVSLTPNPFTPGRMLPVPTEAEAGWTPVPVWATHRRENSWSYWDLNSDPSVNQPLASHYTDWATSAPTLTVLFIFNLHICAFDKSHYDTTETTHAFWGRPILAETCKSKTFTSLCLTKLFTSDGLVPLWHETTVMWKSILRFTVNQNQQVTHSPTHIYATCRVRYQIWELLSLLFI